MIQSEKHERYFTMREPFGITRVRTGMVWGKHFMIQFLKNLGAEWGRDPYWQFDDSGNWADIPLGDISVEGGGPKRSVKNEFNGHNSHRCGVDVDIYVIGKDGIPSESVIFGKDNFDFERTKLLATAILEHGSSDIDLIFIGGDELVEFMISEAERIGLSKRIISNDKTGEHHNHFHVRLKNKDRDLMCVS